MSILELELLNLTKLHKKPKKYKTDQLLLKHGHEEKDLKSSSGKKHSTNMVK